VATYDKELMIIEVPNFKPVAATKIPKKMGSVADLMYKTRQTRLALQKQVDALQAQETLLKNHVINNLPKSNATGTSGQIGCVKSVPKSKYVVEDWEKVYRYIKRHNAFEMLQKQLGQKAVEERALAAGKRGLPGIGLSGYTDVSLTKA